MRRLHLRSEDLLAAVHAGLQVEVVRTAQFAGILVLDISRLLQRVGGKSLGAVYHPMANADYSSFLLQAQSSGAKVVAFSNAILRPKIVDT